MKKLVLIALSTFAVSANAWEPTFYAGSNLSSAQFRLDAYESNMTVKSLELVGGAILAPYISVEARLGLGLGGDQEYYKLSPSRDADGNFDDKTDYPVSFKTNYYASAYFRPFVSNDTATLYGLLGYTTADMDMEHLNDGQPLAAAPFLVDNVEAGVSYGFGVSFKVNEKINVTGEWKEIIHIDDLNIRGGSIGLTYEF